MSNVKKLPKAALADLLADRPGPLPTWAVRDAVVSSSSWGIVSVAAAHTVGVYEEYVRADATSGNLIITLSPASVLMGAEIIIKKTDATANTVTVLGAGSDLIDGAATHVLSGVGQSVRIVSFGTGWDIIATAFGYATVG